MKTGDTPHTPFLRAMARELVARYGADLRRVAFVLPSRRATFYLERELRLVLKERGVRLSHSSRPLILPLAAWLERVSGLKTATRLQLLFSLHKAWNSLPGVPPTQFEAVRAWGETILQDFDEIDAYDIPAKGLFQNLARNAEISTDYLTEQQRQIIAEYFDTPAPPPASSFWRHFNPSTPLGERFLSLWDRLYPLYTQLRKTLSARGLAYPGMLLRRGADILESTEGKALKHTTIVFAGFDVLPSAQRRLFSTLKDLGENPHNPITAIFFWDAPGEALAPDSPIGAGRFQHKNSRLFPCSIPGFEKYTEGVSLPEDIRITSSPGASSQALVIADELSPYARSITAEDTPEKSFISEAKVAVVLPDENLLFPVLHALPPELRSTANVTMGLPLRLSGVSSFATLLRTLFLTARRQGTTTLLHTKEVRALLAHPYSALLLSRPKCLDISGRIVQTGMLYISRSELSGLEPDPVLEFLMPDLHALNSGLSALLWIRDILHSLWPPLLSSITTKQLISAQQQSLLTFQEILDGLIEEISLHGLDQMSPRSALSLLDRLTSSSTTPLDGEPNQGLQVMGMLETRCLDFHHIIIPSMNERIFPRRLRPRSFIPDSLRSAWLLPTLLQKEQQTAYLFYRLIARARHLHLIYDSSSSGLKSGDPSRFLLQLQHLLRPSLSVSPQIMKVGTPTTRPISVEKTDEDLAPFLQGHRRLSASSLKTYLACPLQFYFKYILGIKSEKEASEYIDAAQQGTIVHETLQDLYDSLLPPLPHEQGHPLLPPRPVTAPTVRSFLDASGPLSVSSLVTEKIRKYYPPARRSETLPEAAAIIGSVLERYARTCLRTDLTIVPFHYLSSELRLVAPYTFSPGKTVNFTLIIDRVDRINGQGFTRRLRLVDYKTGADDLSCSNMDTLFTDSHAKGILQLFLYSALLPDATPDPKYPLSPLPPALQPDEPIVLSIYSPTQIELYGPQTTVSIGDTPVTDHRQFLPLFLEKLNEKLQELFDTTQPFTQCALNPYLSPCGHCDFAVVCGRNA